MVRTAISPRANAELWIQPLSALLDTQIGGSLGKEFEAVIVDIPGTPTMEFVLENKLVDFVFTPAQDTTCFEALYGVAPLVTAKDINGFGQVGGIIFTKPGGVSTIEAIKDHVIAASLHDPLTGYLLQSEEYLKITHRQILWDAKQVLFYPTQEQVVASVVSGFADVGFTALDKVESRVAAGELIIIHELHLEDNANNQDITTSSNLAPGWSLSAAYGTDFDIQREVLQLFLGLPSGHPDMLAAGSQGWLPPLSHGHLRDFIEEQNMLVPFPDGHWECYTDMDDIYHMIGCGEGFKLREELTFSHCTDIGLECPAGVTCLCDPCFFQNEIEIFAMLDNGTLSDSCSKMHVCGRTQQRQQISYLIRDNLVRETVRVEYRLHDSRVQALDTTVDSTISLNVTRGYGESISPGNYRINITTNTVGLHILEILVNSEQIFVSPVFVGITPRDCEEVGSHRVPNEEGDCICDGVTMEVLRHCVRRSTFFSASLIPVVILMAGVLVMFIRAKIRAADAFWLIELKDLKFPDPPEILGQGTYGEVLKAWYLGTEVAVKRAMSGAGHAGSKSGSAGRSASLELRNSGQGSLSSPGYMGSVFGNQPLALGRAPGSPSRQPFASGSGSPTRAGGMDYFPDPYAPTPSQLRRLAHLAGEGATASAGRTSVNSNHHHSRHSSMVGAQALGSGNRSPISKKPRNKPSVISKMPEGPDEAPSSPKAAIKPSSPESNGSTSHPLAPENPSGAVLDPNQDDGGQGTYNPKMNGSNGSTNGNGIKIPEPEITEAEPVVKRALSGSTLMHPKRVSVVSDESDGVKSPASNGSRSPRPRSPGGWRGRNSSGGPRSPRAGSRSPIIRNVNPERAPPHTMDLNKPQSDIDGASKKEPRWSTGSAPNSDIAGAASPPPLNAGVDDVTANSKDITVPPPQTLKEAVDRFNKEKPAVRTRAAQAQNNSIVSKFFASTSVGRTIASAISIDFTENGSVSWWNQRHMREDFIAEMRILSRLRHPCITTVMGAVINRKDAMLVMEFMRYGSLYDMLQNDLVEMDTEMMKNLLLDVTSGMEFLHSNNPPIVHGDLKTGNILVDQRFRAKVADFGFSMEKRRGAGTPLWMAPELLEGGYSTLASDVYAFGITVYEVSTRKVPYESDQSLYSVLQEIMDMRVDRRPTLPERFPERLKVLMQECWTRDPMHRPSFTDVKRRLEALNPESDFPQTKRQSFQRQRSDGLVYDMFPKHVAEALVKGEKVPEDNSDCATVFFSDIVGFTKLSSEMESHQVSEMLDRLFTKFDKLANIYGVYKLETIGDCYIGITNLVESQKDDHVARIANFCLGVQAAARDTLVDENDPTKGSVVIRAGFDCGPVVGNVVGTRNKKYTIFGNTVNTASRMESTGIPGRIQCTKKAGDLLLKQDGKFEMEDRGTVAVKGRGELSTCFLNGPTPKNLTALLSHADTRAALQALEADAHLE